LDFNIWFVFLVGFFLCVFLCFPPFSYPPSPPGFTNANTQVSLLKATTPQELLDAKDIHEEALARAESEDGGGSSESPVLPFSPNKVLAKCVVQLQLVGVVDKVVQKHWSKFTGAQLEKWLDMLSSVHDFAKRFQKERGLRFWLWKGGFMLRVKMKNDRPPSLLSQESQAVSSIVHIVFHLLDGEVASRGSGGGDNAAGQQHEAARRLVAEPRLVAICTEVLEKFIGIDRKLSAAKKGGSKVGLEALREVQMFFPIVVHILKAFEGAPAPFFRANLGWLWPLLAQLVCIDYSTDELDAREVLSSLMEKCVGPVVAAGVEKLTEK
jgi:hypothetical protein